MNRPHLGIDIRTPHGTDVISPSDGKVINYYEHKVWKGILEIEFDLTYNNSKVIMRFLHLSNSNLKKGDKVSQGQIIGQTGTAGTGPHLHLEVILDGKHINPKDFYSQYK